MSSLGLANQESAAELLPLLYDELRCLARSSMARLRPGQTLQTTALVHEAWLRTVGARNPGWDSRGHFFGAAAQAMRQIIVDQARRKLCQKRGAGARREGEPDLLASVATPAGDLLALDEALDRLEQESARRHRVVMLRFFAGLTASETAELLDVSERTVQRDWRFARAWLHMQLGGSDRGQERESSNDQPASCDAG